MRLGDMRSRDLRSGHMRPDDMRPDDMRSGDNVIHQRAAHTTELRTFSPIYNPENLNI